ncbi:MAG: hypothetical protein JNL70_26235 [Saprospiraceae bacterium]|nr:hypothetical protein [Saprospiraceae bacterium]
MTTHLQTITISFPELRLQQRDAHKLRGYFGNMFREHSPLLHNHFEDGRSRYVYPKVQYKVLQGTPYLVGIGSEAAHLMTDLFLNIHELDIDGERFPVFAKNIEARNWTIGVSQELHTYRFQTLWMALNQPNYALYQTYSEERRADQLRGIATQNVLAFFHHFGLRLPADVRVILALQGVESHYTHFKNQKMQVFKGQFVTNALLPDFVGLGKSVARGFGTIKKI